MNYTKSLYGRYKHLGLYKEQDPRFTGKYVEYEVWLYPGVYFYSMKDLGGKDFGATHLNKSSLNKPEKIL